MAQIPAGKVATYGQIAELAGLPRQARWVGRMLSGLPKGSKQPWFRVVNARGESSLPGEHGRRQRKLLRAEGVLLRNNRISLKDYQWDPAATKQQRKIPASPK